MTLPLTFCSLCFFLWQLCKNDSAKHYYAADDLTGAQTLSEDDPAGENGNAGFQAKDQGGYGRIHIFLTYDLEGVGYTTGHDTGIENRAPGSGERGKLRMLQNGSGDGGEEPADQKLDAGHFHTICLGGEIVNDQNVQGKQNCTDQDKDISFSHGEAICDAQQIKADQSHGNCDPDKRAAFLFHKKSQNGDDDNIACGKEACFSNRGILDSKLLEVRSKAQADAAGNSSQDQGFGAAGVCLWGILGRIGRWLGIDLIYQKDDGD